MVSLVLLSSYPRSGNTFLRALLANYHSGLDRALTVDEISHYGVGEKNETLWQACTGLSAQDRTFEVEWRARAAYYARLRIQPGAGPLMVKTHTFNGEAFNRPAFDIRPGDRAIHIVRHPLDVLISAAHFFELEPADMAAHMLASGAVNGHRTPPFEATGSWRENVIGWLNETRCPVLFIRYRDLCSDTAGELRRILKFIGSPQRKERIERTLEFCRFEWLQQSNRQDGFYQGPNRDRRAVFFRNGTSDQWRTELPRVLAAEMGEALGDVMDLFSFERPPALAATSFGGVALPAAL